jgi:hypothetical protein
MKVGIEGVYEWVYSTLDTSPKDMVMARGLSILGLFALSPNWPVVDLLGSMIKMMASEDLYVALETEKQHEDGWRARARLADLFGGCPMPPWCLVALWLVGSWLVAPLLVCRRS